MDLRIMNIHVVDPANHVDCICNIYVKDGKIAELSDNVIPAKETLDGTGLTATPGLVDVHCHLRDPGLTYKEDIATGTKAAGAGGITSVFVMPNTKPVTDCEEVIDYINATAKESGSANVYVVPAMTKGLEGKEVGDFAMYQQKGILAVTDDGKAVENPLMMKKVMEEAKKYNLLPVCHCDDVAVIDGGVMNEGATSTRLGVKGNPWVSETLAVSRDMLLCEYAGFKVHIQHVSSGVSLQLIKEAKKRGVNVSCETGPHYFTFTDEAVEQFGANARMNPPLRCRWDRTEILKGLADGTIDCIATDHAPHSIEEKEGELATTMNGIVGFETSFGASYTALVKTGVITFSRLIALMSVNPAKRMGIDKGSLAIGKDADIAIFDLNEEYEVDKTKFYSKGQNTPFHGMRLTGKVKFTILGGKVVYKDK